VAYKDSTLSRANEEHRLEIFIGGFLRVCVIVVVIVVAIGAIAFVPSHLGLIPDYSHFTGEPRSYNTVSGIIAAAFRGDALGIVQLGMLLLILTPILRVGLSVVAFIREKDNLYVAMTLVVLGLLLYSLLAG
jgi:uncharacterized membrane protein